MAGDGSANLTTVARHLTAHQCLVNLFHAAPGKLSRERKMSIVVLGDHQAATGIFIEPMDDPGTRHTADSAELAPAMMQQRVHKRVLLVAGGWMHHQSGGLVEHA